VTAYLSRYRALWRDRWPQVIGAVILLLALELARIYSINRFQSIGWISWGGLWLAPVTALLLVPGVAGAFAVEASRWRGRGHVIARVVAAVSAVGLAILLCDTLWPMSLHVAPDSQTVVSKSAFVLRCLWYYSMASLLLGSYFVLRDHDAVVADAARAAELERANAQRAVMESRLKVIQARVEPQLLFGALMDVSNRYAVSPAAADQLLDDLIAYLRAALPQMRDTASTLGREMALAEAYVKVLPAGRDGTLRLRQRADERARALRFPPMVLLPLVDAAAQSGERVIDVEATVGSDAVPGSARVALVVTAAQTERVAGWEGAKLGDLRIIVASYFGAGARVDVEAAGAGVALRLSFAVAMAPDAPAESPLAA
jgi:hypothetical protein